MPEEIGSAAGDLDAIMSGSKLARPVPVRDRWGRWHRDPGAQWDWWYEELDPPERAYLARRYMAPTGVGPDEVATWLGTDVDDAMRQWVGAARRVRAAEMRKADPLAGDYDDQYGEEVDPLDLVGPDEVCAMLQVQRPTIAQWRHRGLLPAPDMVLSSLPIWHRSTIADWAAATGRAVVDPDAP